MQRYKGHLCGIKAQEIAVVCERDLYTTIIVALVILYTIADSSGIGPLILIRLVGVVGPDTSYPTVQCMSREHLNT